MLITHEQLAEINGIQTTILSAVAAVCQKLNIVFYPIHGTMLGTVRNNGFIPDDDDIDIAFMRDQYDLFIKEAPQYLDKRYFIQSALSEDDYPMEFAKVRDSQTTYIVETAKNLSINHGIYIDVFPIDNCYDSRFRMNLYNMIHKFYDVRIASEFYTKKRPVAKRCAECIVKILVPNLKKAVRKREKLNISVKKGSFLKISGGKKTEIFIPAEWFNESIITRFEGIEVCLPVGYDAYLRKIYGEYESRTLVEKKYCSDEFIEVNACIVDTEKPFGEYLKALPHNARLTP